MNFRVLVAGLYMVLFLINLVNVMFIPSATFEEVMPVMLSGVVASLIGVLIALWVYEDGDNIRTLHSDVVRLNSRLNELEKGAQSQ